VKLFGEGEGGGGGDRRRNSVAVMTRCVCAVKEEEVIGVEAIVSWYTHMSHGTHTPSHDSDRSISDRGDNRKSE